MENKMKQIYKYIFIATALSLSGMATAVNAPKTQMQTQDLPSQEMISQNKEIVTLAAEAMSKDLPQTIDKYTNLVSVQGVDSTLIYIYEINTGAKSDEAVIKEDKIRMMNAVTKGICRSSKRFLDAKITISYIYRSAKSKADLFKFDVKQADCVKF